MKNIFLVVVLFAMSCSPDNVDSFENKLSGYYEVISMQSNVSVDLNNDGVKSRDIFFEIASPAGHWDFNFPGNYLEVRPLKNSSNGGKLMLFNLPGQYIDYLSNGTPFLSMYVNTFINYSYEFNKNSNFIRLINNNPDYYENGSLNTLELLDNGELKLELTKRTFDFVSLDWIDVKMSVVFRKVK